MREKRFNNYINCLTPIAENIGLKEKLSDIYLNNSKYFQQCNLGEADARLCAYYEVIKAIRKKEEERQDA